MEPGISFNKIYFISLEEKLPRWYAHLAEYFAILDIQLIPVTLGELKDFTQNGMIHLICSDTSFSSRRRIMKALKGYLGFAVRNNLITVHHLSSFRLMDQMMELRSRNQYYYYKLPCSMVSFCMHVSSEFFAYNNKKRKWPGGRRAQIPDS